jgi:hypothetical protein
MKLAIAMMFHVTFPAIPVGLSMLSLKLHLC